MKLRSSLPAIVMGFLPLTVLIGCVERKYDPVEDAGLGDGSVLGDWDGGRDRFVETGRFDGLGETRAPEAGAVDVLGMEVGVVLPVDAPVDSQEEDVPAPVTSDGGTEADAPVVSLPIDAAVGSEAGTVKSDVPRDTNTTVNPDAPVVLDTNTVTPPDTALPPPPDAPVVDTPPGATCTIGGAPYAHGATKSDNICLVCNAGASTTDWSNNTNNTACPTGYCRDGVCTAGCLIGTSFYATGAVNTGVNACQSCQPSVRATEWSPRANGLECGTGQVCSAGTCTNGCWIEGALVSVGTRNTTQCASCQTSNTQDWTPIGNGTSCGAGKVCSSGACATGCWINGLVSAGPNPNNECQTCAPLTSTTAWQSQPLGTPCGTGQFCSGGVCQTGCFIGTSFYSAGAVNPSNPCQVCSPSVNNTDWTQKTTHECSVVSAGQYYSCAVKGGVGKCWGWNGGGNVGNGTWDTTVFPPASVLDLGSNVQAIATASDSYHTCALVGGGVKCWGTNSYGQLGIGDSNVDKTWSAVSVPGLTSGVIGIAVGSNYSCALLANSSVKCWGSNFLGEIGITPVEPFREFSPGPSVALGGPATVISLGYGHSCAVVNGGVQCWGTNANGQLGNASAADPSVMPVWVTTLGAGSGVQAISSNLNHTCALVSGSVKCWGMNGNGQLGNNTRVDATTPVPVQGLPAGVAVTAITAGGSHSCAVADGYVYCWGNNNRSQLGDTSTQPYRLTADVRYKVQGLANIQTVSAGNNHTCAGSNGRVWCWGYNGNGGAGTTPGADCTYPILVSGL